MVRVCVVGGVNVDLAGLPDTLLKMGDSNPGRVTVSPGGVGRNIAESLARLGAEVHLVTAFGDDMYADWLRAGCERAGIALDLAETVKGTPSGTYLCLNDEQGNLCAAVSDMRVCESITPSRLAGRLPALNRADAVVVDANLPEATIRWLVDYVRVPMAADTVSVKKARRLRDALPSLALLKPNLPEACALAETDPDAEDAPARAARALTAAGVRSVMITLGGRGVWYADANRAGLQPCLTRAIVSTNGCGDASLSAALLALLE
ncbi:MAG: carbohydrate kinase family protein, partial [Oscillospiraceae bacterium]|nr:carbohydrate kinase family protein [Oscillospiraceae bacterium]